MIGSENTEKIELPEPWEDWPLKHDPGVSRGGESDDFCLGMIDDGVMNLLGQDYFFMECEDAVTEPEWFRIRNRDSGLCVMIEIGADDITGDFEVQQLFFVPQIMRSVSSADLRKLPLSSIVAAYGERKLGKRIEDNLRMTTDREFGSESPRRSLDEITDEEAMRSLKNEPRGRRFYGLVALQYRRFQKTHPDQKTAEVMSKFNDSHLSSVQRWIAQARKLRLLAPAKWVK